MVEQRKMITNLDRLEIRGGKALNVMVRLKSVVTKGCFRLIFNI